MLFSNQKKEQLPKIDGFSLKEFLEKRNVEIVSLPLTWKTPNGYFGKWRNQFYIFDILQFFEKYAENEKDAFVVLDSDCLVNQPLDQLFEQIRQYDLLTLPMHFGKGYNINGVTRLDMQRIFGEIDGGKPLVYLPEYFGGEIFAATQKAIKKINEMFPEIWQEMQKRFYSGEPKLNEEAHFLSYCYYKIENFGSLKSYIRRIWTSPKFANVVNSDLLLPIWHLPAEKTGGIELLFRKLKSGQKLPTDIYQLGSYVGVPRRKKWLSFRQFVKYSPFYRWIKK